MGGWYQLAARKGPAMERLALERLASGGVAGRVQVWEKTAPTPKITALRLASGQALGTCSCLAMAG